MQRIFLEFDFSDKDLAELISNSTPPKGVTVDKPSIIIKASAGGGIFSQIVISFMVGVGSSLVADWIRECIKKSNKKKGRINGQKIDYNKSHICRIIQNELQNQRDRDEQRRRDKNRSTKKRK